MGSRGSGYSSGNGGSGRGSSQEPEEEREELRREVQEEPEEQLDKISEAKDFDELQSALSQRLGNVTISADMRKNGNFELIRESMGAVDRMTELFPMLKDSGMEMDMHTTQDGAICGMSPTGKLAFFKKFFKKKDPEEISDDGSYHPKGFGYEQNIAHELGHKLELLLIKKRNPGISQGGIQAKYELCSEFRKVAQRVYQKMQAKGFTGNMPQMMKAVSGYARQDWSEFGAECVADVFSNGDNASEVSRLFVETYMEMYNE